jgi:prepilin-type N-terminal cleavage/methylation domain-containing protein
MRLKKGFTLVEVIIVIVVIVILTTIATFGINKYLADSRDAQRVASSTTIADSLEKYYDANGEYPSCAQLTAPASTVSSQSGALSGIDTSALVAPKADSSTTNSISCSDLASTADGDYFAYIGDGSDSCSTVSCLQFTIKYLDESDGTIKTINSKRTVDINTSGAVTVTAGSVTYTSASISWNSLQNATGYTIQRDTSNTFSTGNLKQVSVAPTVTSYQFTDLAPNTTYYYRVQANATVNNSSLWSNIANKATSTLPTPTLANAQVNPVTVTESWNSTSGITAYSIQRATASSFSGAQTDSVTGTSKTYSDTPINAARYYRVRAAITNAGNTYYGAWSNVINYTSYVPQPTSSPSVSSGISGSTATGTSGTVSCTQGSTPVYSLRETHKANSGNGDSWTGWTSWSTSRTYSVTAYQGYQHTFQAKAACQYDSVESTERTSGTSSSVRGINQPSTPTWPSGLSKSWQQNTWGHYMWYGTYCPAGTWVNETWFHSRPWAGASPADNYHEFGFNDWWWLGPSGGANVFYEARYTCASSYTSSAWSPLSSDYIWVYW